MTFMNHRQKGRKKLRTKWIRKAKEFFFKVTACCSWEKCGRGTKNKRNQKENKKKERKKYEQKKGRSETFKEKRKKEEARKWKEPIMKDIKNIEEITISEKRG